VELTLVASSTLTITYGYDPLERLTAADYSDGSFFHYTYDAAGNRLSETTPSESNLYTYDDANRLANVNGVAYAWDANGNLLSDGANTYTYDGANRLTGVTDGGSAVSYAYNGLGDRLQTSASGQTTRYTLDLVSGLTQVLDDGGYTYLYGNGRIAQYGTSGGEYFLGDALGSVRQLADAAGAVRLTRSYQPYGELFASNGEGASVYGFTGEATDALTGMVYLRARYYDPVTGRLLSKDIWQGDYYRPLTMNGWNYVEANPVNLADPTGLYSSNAIHAMIQAHFEGTYGASHIVVPEFFVAGGSKQGLQLENDPSGNPLLTGIPTGEAGYIDIVDITTHQAYEIKHEREILNARAEINWYISIYNQNPRPAGPANLTLGTNYRWAQNGWEVIGTNPYYPGQVILAQMKASGVISYKGEYKDKIPVPLPRYVWEWDPDKKAVEKRDRTKIPDWIPNPAAAYSDAIEVCKVVIVVGGTIIILIDPLPDEPLLPFIWGVVP
jgi:RHS repeat-associated protein